MSPPGSPRSLWLCPCPGGAEVTPGGYAPHCPGSFLDHTLVLLHAAPQSCCCGPRCGAQPGPRGPPGRARVPGKTRGLSSARLEFWQRVTAAQVPLAGLEAPSVACCSRHPRPGPHSPSGWRCNPWEGSALATGCGSGCDKPSSMSSLWHQSLSMHQP